MLISLSNHVEVVASWLKIPRLRKEDTLCQENIRFMRNALDDCVRNCDHYRATGFVPSRLLDLGGQMSLDSIRLIDSCQIVPNDRSHAPRARYAALSYCWGSPLATDSVPHLRATIQSLQSMKRHIHEKTIPPTILDAIKVCKALSIRYLWADSLCIIQDEKSDWERESASMTLIYKNAFVTVCTPSSESSNEHFLIRHRKHIAVPFQSRLVPSIYGHYNLVASGTCRRWRIPSWPRMDVKGTSWNSRGWTLQEFQMSNRILIFGTSMIHFLCRHTVQSENGYRRDSGPSRIIQTLDSYAPDMYPEVYYSEWEKMLHDYGHKLFTVIEDKLPAISGMAKYIADETGDEYLAGLWKSQLPSALVWYANLDQNFKYHIELPDLLNMLHSPKPYIAPSWSPVRLDVGVRRGFPQIYKRHAEESTVVDAMVSSVGENPCGRVQYGRIRIRGRSMTVLSDITRLSCCSDDPLWYNLEKGVVTYYNLDYVPRGNSNSQGQLSRLLIESRERHYSLHERYHLLPDDARHCLTNRLPLHATGQGRSPNLYLTGFRGQTEQDSDKTESERGSSRSRGPSVAQGSKSVEAELPTQRNSNSDDSSEESKSAHIGLFIHSEDPRNHTRDAFGLLIHSLPESNDYVRVGVWASLVADGGGTALFDDIDEQEIDIV